MTGDILESILQHFSEGDVGFFSGCVSRIDRFFIQRGVGFQGSLLPTGSENQLHSPELEGQGWGPKGTQSREMFVMCQPGDLLSKTPVDVT